MARSLLRRMATPLYTWGDLPGPVLSTSSVGHVEVSEVTGGTPDHPCYFLLTAFSMNHPAIGVPPFMDPHV